MTTSANRDTLYAELYPLLREPSAQEIREVTPIYGSKVWSFCPAHADGTKRRRRSLKLDAKGIYCFAGCDFKSILEGLKGRPMPQHHQDGDGHNHQNGIRREWHVGPFTHVRIDYPNCRERHGKACRDMWWMKDGKNGLDKYPVSKIPMYGSDRLADLPDGAMVVVVEGEDATDSLLRVGIPAVGTYGADWKPDLSVLTVLGRFNVVTWRDADQPGEAHMQAMADRLNSMAQSVRWFEWEDAPPAGDATDYLKLYPDAEELRQHLAVAPTWTPAIAPAPPAPTAPEKTLKVRTAREIGDATPEAVPWIVPDYIAEKAITELSAKIKMGKTTLLVHLIAAVLDGKPFLDRPTKQTKVMLLTEQSDTTLREALEAANLLDREDLYIISFADTIAQKWADLAHESTQMALDLGCGLYIVDTLPQFAKLRGESENSSGAALEAMEPLQEGAALGLGVLITRHEKKGISEIGESGRGSSAFGGAVDLMLSLRKGEGNARPTMRVLHALGRFRSTPERLVIELGPNGYESMGTETAVAAKEARNAVLDVLPATAEGAKTISELMELTGAKRTILDQVLGELVADGTVHRLGLGKRGSPFKFWRPDPVSFATRSQQGVIVPKEIVATDAAMPEEDASDPDIFLSQLRGGSERNKTVRRDGESDATEPSILSFATSPFREGEDSEGNEASDLEEFDL